MGHSRLNHCMQHTSLLGVTGAPLSWGLGAWGPVTLVVDLAGVPGPCYSGHIDNEPEDGRSIFLSLSSCLPLGLLNK